jgi:hypothetical protein
LKKKKKKKKKGKVLSQTQTNLIALTFALILA